MIEQTVCPVPSIWVRFTNVPQSSSSRLLSLLFLAALLLARPGWAQQPVDSPNFDKTDDILLGKHTLLTVDDVVFGSRLLDTNDSKVTRQQTAPDTAFATQSNSTRRGEVLAHMFAGSGDVLVYTTTNKVIVYDPRTRKSLSLSVTDNDGFASSLSTGDLTDDQYDDVVIGSASGVRVLTATDPNDFGKGIRLGPLASASRADQPNAVGDFTGSGNNQIAQIVTTAGADIYIFSVNPKTLELSRIGGWKTKAFPDRAADRTENLAIGHFLSRSQNQLLFGKTGIPGADGRRTVSLELLEFDQSIQPHVRDRVDFTIDRTERVILRSGHLDPDSQFDQVVQINDNNDFYSTRAGTQYAPNSHFRVITFNDGKLKLPPTYTRHNMRVFDFSIGNFDRLANGTATLGQQVAVLAGFGFNSGRIETPKAKLQIYDITITPTPGGNTIAISENPTSEYDVGEYLAKNRYGIFDVDKYFQNVPLIAGDLQARSIGLGDPLKITVSQQIRPDVVLSIPPMHVDYVKPYRAGVFPGCDKTTQPCDVNISVLPGTFSTTFSSSKTQETKSVRKSTTSYAYGSEIGGGASTLIGDKDASSFKAEYQYLLKKKYDENVATSNSKYSTVKDSLTSTTGFADHLLFTRERFNIWVYPIMGVKVCPGRATTCAEADKTQAYVEYSASDKITLFDVDATTQDWYQPVNEPGNIFSYPWSIELFEQSNPRAGLLTAPPRLRGIDTSKSSEETDWSKKSGEDVSVGAKTLTTHDNKFTSSLSIGAKGIAVGTINFNSNFNRSSGLETLEDSTIALTSNSGIRVDKPAFSSDIATNYAYFFGGFVYANRSPAIPPARPAVIAADGNPAQLQTRGPLLSAFLANLNSEESGRIASFWTQAYDTPDIALNHPARWSWNKNTGKVTFNGKTSEDPIQQEFYWMKGLYITPSGADGMGPQRRETSVGQPVELRARVYNYSLVDVPEQDRVRVEFYGQVVDKKTDHLVGPAFRINGVSLPPILGFKSKVTEPNWAVAHTVFDPRQFEQTREGNVFLAFWVVVWYEDPAGRKGDEVADHGLLSIPGNWSQISDVRTEAHSNNVGLYGAHTPFYIAASESAATNGPASFARAAQIAPETSSSIVLESMTGTAEHMAKNTKVTVSATLHNLSAQAASQVIAFYDGDPSAGTEPFEVQDIPIIPAGDVYTVSASFRPETPGVHSLYAVADPGTPDATMQAETVTIDP